MSHFEYLFNPSPKHLRSEGKSKKSMVRFEVLCILSYKYVKKVKLNINPNPNIFSEIIELQKMGAVEVFQLKFLIAPFTLG